MNLQGAQTYPTRIINLKFPLSPFNGLAPRNCQTWASLTFHRPGLFLGRALINPLPASAAQSMSASLRKRPNCCLAAKRRHVPISDSWDAPKLFARDHLRKNRCTTPKAGLESVAEVVDIYQQATRRQR